MVASTNNLTIFLFIYEKKTTLFLPLVNPMIIPQNCNCYTHDIDKKIANILLIDT